MTSTEQQVRDKFHENGLNYSQIVGEEVTVVSMSLEGFNRSLQALLSLIEQREAVAYRRGYNDNARDCSCDEFPASPHHHLMDDGKSHDIRPDLETLKENKS